MDCITFNKSIPAFINDELNDEELNDFLNHRNICGKCAEELEINYIVREGMRRVDDRNASLNLDEAHSRRIRDSLRYMSSRKKLIIIADIFRTITFWVLAAVIFVFVRVTFMI